MNMTVTVGIAFIAFLVVTGLFFVLSRASGRGDEDLEDRLDQFVTREVSADQDQSIEHTPSRFSRGISDAVAEKSFAAKIATSLARANLKLTVGEYIILQITSILGMGVVFYLVMHQNPFLALGGLVAGYFLPGMYVKMRQGKRLQLFNSQLGDAINMLANGLRSGYSLLQAMDAVANEMPPPISVEFQRVVREVGLGITSQRAMSNMLRRVPSDDLDLLITAINVQHEVGGNLAEILETISHTIRERVRIKGEIRVLTSQQMMSGYVISALPIGLGLILFAMNPDYMGKMFKDVCGIAMMSCGGIMIVAGFVSIMKIVNIEV